MVINKNKKSDGSHLKDFLCDGCCHLVAIIWHQLIFTTSMKGVFLRQVNTHISTPVTPEPNERQRNKHTETEYLSSVDEDHLKASDSGVHVCERQAGLQHLRSHHAGDEGDVLLHSSSWTQREHPRRRQRMTTVRYCNYSSRPV